MGAHGEARWNAADGTRPSIASEREIESKGYLISTPIVFASFTPLRQHSLESDPTATFVTIGGQAGEDTYQADGLPPPDIGGRYIVVIFPLGHMEGVAQAGVLLISYVYPIDTGWLRRSRVFI